MKIAPSDTLPTCPNLTVAGAGVGVAAAVPDALTAGTGCGFGPQAASANTETRVRRTKVFTALATPGVVGGVYRRSRWPRRDLRRVLPPARSPNRGELDGVVGKHAAHSEDAPPRTHGSTRDTRQ